MSSGLPDTGSTAYVLLSAALVLLMTPALALFYGGFVGERMAISTMLMSFAALSVITVEWSILTYSLAFSTHPDAAVDPFIGGAQFVAFPGNTGNNLRMGTSIPETANFVYQLSFAAVTSAVISGGVVGRITYNSWCLFIALWHLLVYVPLAHWIFYPGGWLAKLGVLDFAGGLVVETNSGVSAFVLAAWVSWATRRAHAAPKRAAAAAALTASSPEAGGAWVVASAAKRKPHNVPFILLGAGLLMFGWLGFNSASGLSVGFQAARAFLNTTLAAASGMLGLALAETVWGGDKGAWGLPTAVGCATGVVVGLVAITPACGFISPMASLVLGFAAALLAYRTEGFLRARLPYVDDTLACFTGHGVGGMVGIFVTGLVASVPEGSPANGAVYGNPALLGWQVVGIIITVLMASAGTSLAWGITVLVFRALRLPSLVAPERMADPDSSLHGERAYTGPAGGGSVSMGGSSAGLGGGAGLTEAAVLAIVRRELKARGVVGGVALEVRQPAEGAWDAAAAEAAGAKTG